MAWTTPETFTNGTVVADTNLNKFRDNFRYLKGLDGATSFESDVAIGTSSAPSYRAHVVKSDATATRTGAVGAELAVENSSTGGVRSAAVRLRAADTGATVRSAARLVGSFAAATYDDSVLALQTADGSETFRDAVVLRGANVGIGTTSPQGRLHISASHGGALLWSGLIDGTLRTALPAATVSNAATFYGVIYTAGDTEVMGNAILVGGSLPYGVGTSTVTIAVTAGGAVTIQRTAGSQTLQGTLWIIWT